MYAVRLVRPARRCTSMKKTKTTTAARIRRHARVRKGFSGSSQRPRLAVYRSLSHIYAQVIDDSSGHTLVAASDLEAGLRGQRNGKKKAQVAELVGEALARQAAEKGSKAVVFAPGGFKS